ncbi:MAG: alanine racemase [Anaerolinea sp.]|nr:alanine racemase [Anaerolinea sp.]
MLDGIVTWAEIDLDAIAENVRAFKQHIGDRVELIAVVKANAYGHGAVPVAHAALQAGATRLAVHRMTEGIELRQAGISAPIIIMGYTPPSGVEQIIQWNLTPSLITLEFAESLSSLASSKGIQIPVHIKVDTGMNRYGILPPEVLGFSQSLLRLPGLFLEGLFTHFATADWNEQVFIRRQLAVFNDVVAVLQANHIEIPILHAANSATTFRLPDAHFNAVRIGIAMYGLDPSDEWSPVFEIRPALTMKSLVSRVRDIPAGVGISYGRTYITEKAIRVALVPAGYGDGFHRILSNKGEVLIRGKRAPILGRICMDQFVVDISGIPCVKQDDEVVIIGRQGEDTIRAEEIARLAGTINYEVTTSLLPRVTRVYLRNGEMVSQFNP